MSTKQIYQQDKFAVNIKVLPNSTQPAFSLETTIKILHRHLEKQNIRRLSPADILSIIINIISIFYLVSSATASSK